jgi:hypothetical protein
MVCTDALQAFTDGCVCNFRAIAITTQVPEVKLLQFCRNNLLGGVSRSGIR